MPSQWQAHDVVSTSPLTSAMCVGMDAPGALVCFCPSPALVGLRSDPNRPGWKAIRGSPGSVLRSDSLHSTAAGNAAGLKARGKYGGIIACALAHRANRIAYALTRDRAPDDPTRWT